MDIPLDALVEDIVIPGGVTGLTAKDSNDSWVEKFEGFGPLISLLGIVFFGHLLDLPWTPTFVAEGPVLDLYGCQYD